MFKFLKGSRNDESLIAACAEEWQRLAKAHWQFANMPRDITSRVELLKKANVAGLKENEHVVLLDYFHRLLTALHGNLDETTLVALLEESRRYPVREFSAVRRLFTLAKLHVLEADGLQVETRDDQNRAVYLRSPVEFRRKDGKFEVREDGVTFVGEVVIDIPWSKVTDLARVVENVKDVDYHVLAFQEGSRRTATKFAFPEYDDGAEYACRMTLLAWSAYQRAKQPGR